MTDELRQKIVTNMNSIIVTCLGGPGGDPNECHREAAATAVATMVLLGEKLENIPAAEGLRPNNLCEYDFLEPHGL